MAHSRRANSALHNATNSNLNISAVLASARVCHTCRRIESDNQLVVDKKAPAEVRAQAQGLIVLICFGLGMLIGTFVNVRLPVLVAVMV